MIQPLKFDVEQDTVLDCTVEYQVDNSEFIGVENSFDLYLVKHENAENQLENSSFQYKIRGKDDQGSFNQVFELEKGRHELFLFGRVQDGTIKFSLITVQCFQFSKYPRIPEFEKGN